ncbi:MAG: biotin attachment protein [Planctomycetes bacterium]|nr:biotin attachment protein [Planctomycetota bacterium]
MRREIILPEVGAAPLRVSIWFAEPGDLVYAGDRLVEIVVEGATFDVPAAATGRLAERVVRPDDVVQPGQVLGIIEEET